MPLLLRGGNMLGVALASVAVLALGLFVSSERYDDLMRWMRRHL